MAEISQPPHDDIYLSGGLMIASVTRRHQDPVVAIGLVILPGHGLDHEAEHRIIHVVVELGRARVRPKGLRKCLGHLRLESRVVESKPGGAVQDNAARMGEQFPDGDRFGPDVQWRIGAEVSSEHRPEFRRELDGTVIVDELAMHTAVIAFELLAIGTGVVGVWVPLPNEPSNRLRHHSDAGIGNPVADRP